MARRTQINFPTSYGFVTFLSRPNYVSDIRKEINRKRIKQIGSELQELGKELQTLTDWRINDN